MANRILRDGILTSERVNQIADDPSKEVFYRRTFSVVDDFGRYHAHPSLLRAALYPLRLDQVTDEDIQDHLSSCELAGLLQTYESGGKRYLQLNDFRQQLRAMKSKFPSPDGRTSSACAADGHQVRSIRKQIPSEAESETRSGGENPNRENSERQVSEALWSAFERCRDLHQNCTDPDHAGRMFLSLIDRGEITEADAPLMESGMKRWLDSFAWSEDQKRYSSEWRKFSAWITGFAWRGNPAPSAEAKEAQRVGMRLGDGSDAYTLLVAPRPPKKEAA